MPSNESRRSSPRDSPTASYSYAVIRVTPRVEREEFVNAGIVLLARTRRFLQARIELDPERIRAIDPTAHVALIERHLRTFEALAAGAPEGGPMAALPPADRFHWLTAPRSTVIQTSAVHTGTCRDPEAALEHLLAALVRPPTVPRGMPAAFETDA